MKILSYFQTPLSFSWMLVILTAQTPSSSPSLLILSPSYTRPVCRM